MADVKKGDQVSVYVDLNGKCLKGLMQTFQGDRLFIANGVCMVNRKEVFSTNHLQADCASKYNILKYIHLNVLQK